MHERLIRVVTVGMIAGALAGCNLLGRPSRSAIRFEGAISSPAASERSIGRALGSAAVRVAALPVVAGQPALEAAAEVDADAAEDGAFSVDVDVAEGQDVVLLVASPGDGVGVEQSLGFIELPAGSDESSAGWPVSAAALGTTVELGTIETADGDATVFLPSTDSASLYETLNASQVDLLVTAQRDNYLKAVQNEYLNQSANVIVHYSHFLRGRLDAAYNGTTAPADANIPGSYYFFIQPEIADEAPFTRPDVEAGSPVVTFVPPATVTGNFSGEYGPEQPIDLANDFAQTVDSGDYYLETFGPPAAGSWSVLVDGQTDGVYELGLASPYDNADNFMYYLPAVSVSVDGDSEQITGIEVSFYAYDPVSQSYELLTDVTDTLPLAGEFSISIRSFDDENPFEADTSIDLPAIANTELEPPVELYWEGSSSTYNLSWIDVSYSLGATYVFEMRKERWFF